MKMTRPLRGLLTVLAGLTLAAAIVLAPINASLQTTDAERLAFRIDAVLDQYEAPQEFFPESLDPYWVFEVAPFFQYEGLTTAEYEPPAVIFEPQRGGADHNHLLGYTYCGNEVFINIRVINPMSAWYGWERNPLATLVHEMVHTLGGDFCSLDSATAESATQTAALETLAALANGGNRVALYSLLQELKDMAMGVVLAEALKNDDLDGYREFRSRIDPSALQEARFEKSMRFWRNDMPLLMEILDKYSAKVFANVQAGELVADIPSAGGIGDGSRDHVPLDDLSYVLANMEEMAEDGLTAEGE